MKKLLTKTLAIAILFSVVGSTIVQAELASKQAESAIKKVESKQTDAKVELKKEISTQPTASEKPADKQGESSFWSWSWFGSGKNISETSGTKTTAANQSTDGKGSERMESLQRAGEAGYEITSTALSRIGSKPGFSNM